MPYNLYSHVGAQGDSHAYPNLSSFVSGLVVVTDHAREPSERRDRNVFLADKMTSSDVSL